MSKTTKTAAIKIKSKAQPMQDFHVHLARAAYRDIQYLVGECPQEVGFLATVERVRNHFFVDEIFLPAQTVSYTETDITPAGLADLHAELANSRDDAQQVIEGMRGWFHSHANMSVFASSQDDRTMDELGEAGWDWALRGIFNKQGEALFTLYFYDVGIFVDEIPWSVTDRISEERANQWDQLIAARVAERTYSYSLGKGYNTGSGKSSAASKASHGIGTQKGRNGKSEQRRTDWTEEEQIALEAMADQLEQEEYLDRYDYY